MKKLMLLIMFFAFGMEANAAVRLPANQREILRKWGKAPSVARSFLNDFFLNEEARRVFINPMNKLPNGVSQEMVDRSSPDSDPSEVYYDIPRSLQRRHIVSLRKAQEIIQDFGMVDLSNDNFVLTSNNPNHPLYNYMVVMLKSYWPSPYQLVSRVYQNDKIVNLIQEKSLNRIKIVNHWLYRIPGRPSDIIDYNYIVVVEKVFPTAKNPQDNKNQFEDLQAQANNGAKSAQELLSQMLEVIQGAGIWSVSPTQTLLVEEDGVLKAVFLDAEWPGFAQYSGFRHIYNSDYSTIRPGDVNSGKQGLQNLANPRK